MNRTTVAVLALALGGCRAPELHSTLDAPAVESVRARCGFTPGTPANLTLAHDARVGDELPIDHVLVVIMQGRSFDHLLSRLPGVDDAPGVVINRDTAGEPVPRHPMASYCMDDPPHDWNAHHIAWADGRLDGFVRAGAPAEVMGYYDERDLPGLYAVASRFAVGDRYHASALASPSVNRAFLYAGTGFGRVHDEIIDGEHATLFTALDKAGVDWRVYARVGSNVDVLPAVRRAHPDRFVPYYELINALDAGMLPPVAFVEPLLGTDDAAREDFGAPGDIQFSDDFLVHLVAAVTRSPAWPRTALFVTFVEDGGLYDHVPPPAACPPDDLRPALSAGDLAGGFDRLGFRVPLLVVSPWARPGHVDHTTYDHTSLLRFIEARFHLPALTERDANADPLTGLFDFDEAHLDAPELPTAAPDPAHYKSCDRDDR
jgi:phospholipase C